MRFDFRLGLPTGIPWLIPFIFFYFLRQNDLIVKAQRTMLPQRIESVFSFWSLLSKKYGLTLQPFNRRQLLYCLVFFFSFGWECLPLFGLCEL